METTKTKKWTVGSLLTELSLPLVLLGLMVVFTIISPEFMSLPNLLNLLSQNAHVCVLACAMLMIMICGGADLSLGYQMSMILVSVAIMISWYSIPMWLALVAGLGLSVGMGTLNGILVHKLKTPTMIIGLGTMTIYQGLSYILTGSRSIYALPSPFLFIGQGRLLGIPVNALIALVIILLTGFLLGRTYLGRYFYAIGDNSQAASIAGINVGLFKVIAFSIAGIMVGIAAILLCSRTGSANASMGPGLEFTCITACVLAGVSLKGGVGRLWKVIVAVLVLGVLSNGMQIMGLGVYPQYVAKGIIMLVAVGLDLKSRE